MFVERTPIIRKVQLLMNVHVLIPEDLRPTVVVQMGCEYRFRAITYIRRLALQRAEI